ncbi:MAG TPA: class D sortase [Edaphobacter sp.]
MTLKAKPGMMRALVVMERVLLAIGVVLLGAYVAVRLYGVIASRTATAAFRQSPAAFLPSSTSPEETATSANGKAAANTEVDTSLWSDKRIRAYNDSLKRAFGAPLAILTVPKINLEVPVFEGTDDVTLDRGVGRIAGTARLGEAGNIGIAGHRDGFFRGLKDVTKGDEIRLVLPDAVATYVVDQISVVTPQDVSVLQPRPVSSLTLVTCFPFYFVGSAPERYIVSASLRADPHPAVGGNARPNQ